MVTWIPSIYPLYVSIPAPWIRDGIYQHVWEIQQDIAECLVDQTWSNMVQPDQQISCATASGEEFQQTEVHMVGEIA